MGIYIATRACMHGISVHKVKPPKKEYRGGQPLYNLKDKSPIYIASCPFSDVSHICMLNVDFMHFPIG